MNRVIKHEGKNLFPSETKFFKDLIPGERFKTSQSPTIYLAIAGASAIVDNPNETIPKYFPDNMPVITLKSF